MFGAHIYIYTQAKTEQNIDLKLMIVFVSTQQWIIACDNSSWAINSEYFTHISQNIFPLCHVAPLLSASDIILRLKIKPLDPRPDPKLLRCLVMDVSACYIYTTVHKDSRS